MALKKKEFESGKVKPLRNIVLRVLEGKLTHSSDSSAKVFPGDTDPDECDEPNPVTVPIVKLTDIKRKRDIK